MNLFCSRTYLCFAQHSWISFIPVEFNFLKWHFFSAPIRRPIIKIRNFCSFSSTPCGYGNFSGSPVLRVCRCVIWSTRSSSIESRSTLLLSTLTTFWYFGQMIILPALIRVTYHEKTIDSRRRLQFTVCIPVPSTWWTFVSVLVCRLFRMLFSRCSVV